MKARLHPHWVGGEAGYVYSSTKPARITIPRRDKYRCAFGSLFCIAFRSASTEIDVLSLRQVKTIARNAGGGMRPGR